VTADDDLDRYVTVEGVRLRFAAAHMATLGDDLEPLHGHNYEVSCQVRGALTADGWVIDFAVLKRLVREVCERLDHRFLLQMKSPLLEILERGDAVTIKHHERSYVLPARDVARLPITNTTAELLAEWIAHEVRGGLPWEYDNIRRILVNVGEMPGQSAGFTLQIPGFG
jgi:6-pyruvoyltetrahydropterin/6-carboxytetrahydropterin synthase